MNFNIYLTTTVWTAMFTLCSIGAGQSIALTLASGTGAPASSVSLPLSIANNGNSTGAVEWTVAYSTTDFSSATITSGAVATSAGKTLTCNNPTPGKYECMIWSTDTNVLTDGVLAVVNLIATNTPSSNAAVSVSNAMAVAGSAQPIAVTATGATVDYGPGVSSVSCSPASVAAPGSTSCTVTLNGTALSGGATVSLGYASSSGVSVSGPSSVVIPAGSTSGTFALQVTTGSNNASVQIAASLNGSSATFTLAVTDPVTVAVSPPSAVLNSQQQQQFTSSVSGSTNTSVNWSLSPNVGTISSTGMYTAPVVTTQQSVNVIATSVADPTKSAAATVTVNPATSDPSTATFVRLDTASQGNWTNLYGPDGFNIINDTVSYPSYVTVTPSGASPYTWAASTSDVRALSKASSPSDRIAATWFGGQFTIDLAFSDGATHQVAIYCVDWDSTRRAETVDILDANNVVLTTQKLSNFHNGEYLVWQLGGHVKIRVTGTAGANAVVSGLFFGAPATTGPAITGLNPNSITAGAAAFQLSVNGINFVSGATVQWGTTPLTTSYISSTQLTASVPASLITSSGTASITVAEPSGTSPGAIFTVNPSTATFVKLDTTTEGNWVNNYGKDGFNIINDTVSYPGYVIVTSTGTPYTWVASTTDVRALSKASSPTDRIAATWFGDQFVIDLAFNDGATHEVAIYCLDWDSTSRAETVDILDDNNAVLNTQNISNFHNGQYAVWQISGHVKIRVTNTVAGKNAVVSGLFFR